MCLVAFAIDQSRRFPLVIAANRDEFFERPTARLGWWKSTEGATEILGGRDLKDGGTWLGLSAAGRLGLVTNVRDGSRKPDPDAPSRGGIVPLWLRNDLPPDRFWARVALSGHNPFNLVAFDFSAGESWWCTSERATPQRLGKAIYGLSNAGLDDPWPKVSRLKHQMADALERDGNLQTLTDDLIAALGDRSMAHDDDLPETGVPREMERLLSAAFIRTPDKRYGTRSSTLVITERVGRHMVTHVIERTYTAGPGLALLRSAQLKHWPPRYTLGMPAQWTTGDAPVSESSVADDTAASPATQAPRLVRPRARGLLKSPRRT